MKAYSKNAFIVHLMKLSRDHIFTAGQILDDFFDGGKGADLTLAKKGQNLVGKFFKKKDGTEVFCVKFLGPDKQRSYVYEWLCTDCNSNTFVRSKNEIQRTMTICSDCHDIRRAEKMIKDSSNRARKKIDQESKERFQAKQLVGKSLKVGEHEIKCVKYVAKDRNGGYIYDWLCTECNEKTFRRNRDHLDVTLPICQSCRIKKDKAVLEKKRKKGKRVNLFTSGSNKFDMSMPESCRGTWKDYSKEEYQKKLNEMNALLMEKQ